MTVKPQPAEHALKVLLMDDELAVAYPMARYFRSLGCEVDVASEAEEAAALATHRQYDLAVLDLRLTGLSGAEGLDVLREIRRRDLCVTVVVLSAYVSPEADDAAKDLGADLVLAKPQPLPELARSAFALMGVCGA
jgi:CheY-like chemotaxis protein